MSGDQRSKKARNRNPPGEQTAVAKYIQYYRQAHPMRDDHGSLYSTRLDSTQGLVKVERRSIHQQGLSRLSMSEGFHG